MADAITERVRLLTVDPETELHVSIAGGRKTMGFYLGYALSLFGRPQDRLSHVLVSEPFESSWDFFYPTPHSRVITTRDNKLADTAQAHVILAQIPFVRLRETLPERLLDTKARFSEAVAFANRAPGEPCLKLQASSRQAVADDLEIPLGTVEFGLLHWLAERTLQGEPPVDWGDAKAADEFLGVMSRLINSYSNEYGRIESAIAWRRSSAKNLGEYFEPQKSRIGTALRQALGKVAAARYEIKRTGARGQSRYFLPLAPEQIEIS
ncbi:hypothetical protein CCP4SC76_4870001 [Gammaproteobacteria bacterium]